MKRFVSLLIILSMLVSQILPFGIKEACAQELFGLPVPGMMVNPTPAFLPATIKGITIYPEDPLKFDFIIHPGDGNLKKDDLQEESKKLINYFMASLTVPEDEMWVNLSPYEQDRIMAEGLSQTALGRDMLAQDYILKQLTASLMYPEDEIGEAFWEKIYSRAQEEYGTTDIPVNTFNKVWIVPQSAKVYVNDNHVFVSESYLKVLTDSDYLAMNENDVAVGESTDNDINAEIVREIIIPAIEKEVNDGKNFAPLRQMFNSMILATWYKNALKESFLGKAYFDKNKTKGIDLEDKDVKEKIYNRYLQAFEKGVYDYVKDEYDEVSQEIIPRKYFSGGIKADLRGKVAETKITDLAMITKLSNDLPGSSVFTISLDSSTLDKAQMSEIKGALAKENDYKRIQLNEWMVKEFSTEEQEVKIITAEAKEFLDSIPSPMEMSGRMKEFLLGNEVVSGLVNGDFVGFQVSDNELLQMERLYATLRYFVRDRIVRLEGNPDYHGYDVLMYDVIEMMKNAFYHGNKLNGTLPVYMRIDIKNGALQIIDFNNQEEIDDQRAREAIRQYQMVSGGAKDSRGQINMKESLSEYQSYDRQLLFSSQGEAIGTQSIVKFKPKMINQIEEIYGKQALDRSNNIAKPDLAMMSKLPQDRNVMSVSELIFQALKWDIREKDINRLRINMDNHFNVYTATRDVIIALTAILKNAFDESENEMVDINVKEVAGKIVVSVVNYQDIDYEQLKKNALDLARKGELVIDGTKTLWRKDLFEQEFNFPGFPIDANLIEKLLELEGKEWLLKAYGLSRGKDESQKYTGGVDADLADVFVNGDMNRYDVEVDSGDARTEVKLIFENSEVKGFHAFDPYENIANPEGVQEQRIEKLGQTNKFIIGEHDIKQYPALIDDSVVLDKAMLAAFKERMGVFTVGDYVAISALSMKHKDYKRLRININSNEVIRVNTDKAYYGLRSIIQNALDASEDGLVDITAQTENRKTKITVTNYQGINYFELREKAMALADEGSLFMGPMGMLWHENEIKDAPGTFSVFSKQSLQNRLLAKGNQELLWILGLSIGKDKGGKHYGGKGRALANLKRDSERNQYSIDAHSQDNKTEVVLEIDNWDSQKLVEKRAFSLSNVSLKTFVRQAPEFTIDGKSVKGNVDLISFEGSIDSAQLGEIKGPLALENKKKQIELEQWIREELSTEEREIKIVHANMKDLIVKQPRGGFVFASSHDYMQDIIGGNVVALRVGSNDVSAMHTMFSMFTDMLGFSVYVEGNPEIENAEAFHYDVGEMVKNAMFHGNKLNGTLPFYVHLDIDNKVLRVIDLNNKEDRDARRELAAKEGYGLQGDHAGEKNMQTQGESFQKYSRRGIFLENSDEQIGTQSVVHFTRDLIVEGDNLDKAQLSEIKGSLAEENNSKRIELEKWMKKEFSTDEQEVNVIHLEDQELMARMPMGGYMFNESRVFAEKIMKGDIIAFQVPSSDLQVMKLLNDIFSISLRRLLSVEGDPKVDDKDVLFVDIYESIRNALFHGNKLNGTLPVYLRIDLDGNKLQIIDFNNQEVIVEAIEREARDHYAMAGEGFSENFMTNSAGEFQNYSRNLLYSLDGKMVIGSKVEIAFKKDLISELSERDQALLGEIKGSLVEENMIKKNKLEGWMKETFSNGSGPLDIVSVDIEQFVFGDSVNGQKRQLLESIARGDVIAFNSAKDDMAHMVMLYAMVPSLLRNFVVPEKGQTLSNFEVLRYDLREMIKNAYYHGNRLNNSLPIYLRLDVDKNIVQVFDFNNQEERDQKRAEEAQFAFRMTGEHRGEEKMRDDLARFQDFDRESILSLDGSQVIGTQTMVQFKGKFLKEIEGREESIGDKAQLSEIKGPLAAENMEKQRVLEQAMKDEFNSISGMIDIVHYEVADLLRELPKNGSSEEEVIEYVQESDLIENIVNGNVVAFHVSNSSVDDMAAFDMDFSYALQRAIQIQGNPFVSKDYPLFEYNIVETLKNAFYHGNKLNGTLPVYLHVDIEEDVLEVIDLNNQESLDEEIAEGAREIYDMQGEGLGEETMAEESEWYQSYSRDVLRSPVTGEVIGTHVRIVFEHGLVEAVDDRRELNFDRAQLGEIKGPLAEENREKLEFLENQLRQELFSASGKADIVRYDVGEVLEDMPEDEAPLEDVYRYIRESALIKDIVEGNIVAFSMLDNDIDKMFNLYMDLSYNLEKVFKIEGNPLLDSDYSVFEYNITELFKNAFFHGNRLNGTLPVYFHVDANYGIMQVFDLNNQEILKKDDATYAKVMHGMHGDGASEISMNQRFEDYQEYFRYSILSPETNQVMGTKAVIKFVDSLVVHKDIFSELVTDRAQLGGTLQGNERYKVLDAMRVIVQKIKKAGVKRIVVQSRVEFFIRELLTRVWESEFGNEKDLPEIYSISSEQRFFYLAYTKGIEGNSLLENHFKEVFKETFNVDDEGLKLMKNDEILFLDDFSDSGAKISKMGRIMRMIGFQNNSAGVVVSTEKGIKRIESNFQEKKIPLFFGLQEDDLADKMKNILTLDLYYSLKDLFAVNHELQALKSVVEGRKKAVDKEKKHGGIDFNPAHMEIQTQGDTPGFSFPQEFRNVPVDQIEGFTPVIINVAPISNIPLLLGVSTESAEEPEQLSALF